MIPGQDQGWPNSGSSGWKTGPSLDRVPFRPRAHHTPIHSDWDNVDVPLTSRAQLWDVGGNRSPCKTPHTWMGQTCTLHTDCDSSLQSVIFPHQHYKETTLFEDLLYIFK